MAVKQHVRTAAQVNQLDFALLQAVIATESGLLPNAVSPKGAVGLMQGDAGHRAERYGLTSDRAGTVAAKLTDPKTNISTGARYLRDLVNMFPGQLELAVAAYNAAKVRCRRRATRFPISRKRKTTCVRSCNFTGDSTRRRSINRQRRLPFPTCRRACTVHFNGVASAAAGTVVRPPLQS